MKSAPYILPNGQTVLIHRDVACRPSGTLRLYVSFQLADGSIVEAKRALSIKESCEWVKSTRPNLVQSVA